MTNKNFVKFISTILSFALVFNVLGINAFAAEIEVSTDTYQTMDAEYLSELQDMGLSTEQIATLNDVSLKIANATSMREVDALMKEYHAIVDNTALAAATSWSDSDGGTLYLEYTGTMSAMSNVIFTKVIYMGNYQVELYQKAMNSPTILTFLADELIGKGVSIITESVAKQIAAELSLSVTKVNWLIGTSVAALLFVVQNLETWDLNAAIDDSSNGKVKLEFFYSTSISYPYYMEYENFEAWDTNKIEVPANYDYTWSDDVYDCEELAEK